jgi:Flp pilus assembly protein TadG
MGKRRPLPGLLRRALRRGRFARSESGVTAVEFALLAVPFFALVGAILETAMVFLASEVLDAAVNDANRLILTGQAQSATFDLEDFRAAVCDHTFGLFNCDAIHLRVTPIADFGSASIAPPVEPDCEQPCDWTTPQSFSPGVSSSVVMVQAYYKWPVILNVLDFSLATLGDHTRLLAAVRVFRNEPF